MRINVTEEDIEKGSAGSCSECPIALAVKRAFHSGNGAAHQVAVENGEISVYLFHTCILTHRLHAESTPEIDNFISDFDDYKPVQPFSFDVKFQEREDQP